MGTSQGLDLVLNCYLPGALDPEESQDGAFLLLVLFSFLAEFVAVNGVAKV